MMNKKVGRTGWFLRTTGPGPASIWVLFMGFRDERAIEAKESRKNRHIDWLWRAALNPWLACRLLVIFGKRWRFFFQRIKREKISLWKIITNLGEPRVLANRQNAQKFSTSGKLFVQNVCQVEKMHKNRMIFVYFVCQVKVFADFRTKFRHFTYWFNILHKIWGCFCAKIKKNRRTPAEIRRFAQFFMLF